MMGFAATSMDGNLSCCGLCSASHRFPLGMLFVWATCKGAATVELVHESTTRGYAGCAILRLSAQRELRAFKNWTTVAKISGMVLPFSIVMYLLNAHGSFFKVLRRLDVSDFCSNCGKSLSDHRAARCPQATWGLQVRIWALY